MSRPKTPPDILAAIRKARRLKVDHHSFYGEIGICRLNQADGIGYVLAGDMSSELWRSLKIDGRWRKPVEVPLRQWWTTKQR
jgi:hypothetical protein